VKGKAAASAFAAERLRMPDETALVPIASPC
jgi:hypothetical protein